MLTLVRIYEDSDFAEYNFFPEGREAFGTVLVNKKTGETDVKKKADNDFHGWYLRHAVSSITRFFENGEYLQQDTVAWC